MEELEELVKSASVDLVGATNIEGLQSGLHADPESLLPGAKSVFILAARYLKGSMKSANMRMAINDCKQIDFQLDGAARELGLRLENLGYTAILLPSYYPVDMSWEKKGMIGDISLKRAAYLAGLGHIGLNGLLVTETYGPRIRLAGVLTDYMFERNINNETISSEKFKTRCTECRLCEKMCPAHAISPEGINIKACAKYVGAPFGLSDLANYIISLSTLNNSKEEVIRLIRSPALWNFYQTLMVGVFFNCQICQSACPVGN